MLYSTRYHVRWQVHDITYFLVSFFHTLQLKIWLSLHAVQLRFWAVCKGKFCIYSKQYLTSSIEEYLSGLLLQHAHVSKVPCSLFGLKFPESLTSCLVTHNVNSDVNSPSWIQLANIILEQLKQTPAAYGAQKSYTEQVKQNDLL